MKKFTGMIVLLFLLLILTGCAMKSKEPVAEKERFFFLAKFSNDDEGYLDFLQEIEEKQEYEIVDISRSYQTWIVTYKKVK